LFLFFLSLNGGTCHEFLPRFANYRASRRKERSRFEEAEDFFSFFLARELRFLIKRSDSESRILPCAPLRNVRRYSTAGKATAKDSDIYVNHKSSAVSFLYGWRAFFG